MTATNGYEQAARERKAGLLADMLDAFKVTAEDARDLPVIARLDVATAAGVRIPSQETWDRACDLLEQRADFRARVS